MELKLLYRNSDGVKRISVADTESPNSFKVMTSVDVDKVLESVKRDEELLDNSSTNKLLARVPLTVYEQSIHENWDDADWKRWLNEPDNKLFRVWKGKV
jgi:hypothetical protein